MKYAGFCSVIMIFCCIIVAQGQTILGTVRPNTNPALPESYQFSEYVYPEPDDQGTCLGIENTSASLKGIFFAQTQRLSLDHPFYFLIGHRPALFQVAVTGAGQAPDVQVEGFMKGNSLGVKCLKGPAELPSSIDLSVPNFNDYFSVTLPKDWIQTGLSLELHIDGQTRIITPEELKIGPYTELNLVLFEMDLLDYNTEPPHFSQIPNLLAEMASVFPASVVRFGKFPQRLVMPEVIANNDSEQLVRLKTRGEMQANNINSDGSINSIATLFMQNLHRSTQDYLSTFYFGNTLNLSPGGWGGGKSFVGFDYDDVFVHELGHAFSLQHWGDYYHKENPSEWEYVYPYGGDTGNGGGRGESWSFLQHLYEFIDPICQYDARGQAGLEASDAMQRNNHCLQARSYGPGPWEGFGDFSELAMQRYMVGSAELYTGEVSYRGSAEPFQFYRQQGFPLAKIENGQRVYQRAATQPQDPTYEEQMQVLGQENLNTSVYLVYGTAHETQPQANIIYKPIKFTGTLPPIIDPTDPATFSRMQSEWRPFFEQSKDITLKMTYADGSTLIMVDPYQSYIRTADYNWGYHIWRNDLCNFGLVVPGDKELVKVELYNRPLVSRDQSDHTNGNINDPSQNITAQHFMEGATLQAVYPGVRPIAANAIGNRVWNDLNRNGVDDFGEPGIPGVSLLLWADSDGDDIPDSNGFRGVVKTDSSGFYRFSGLEPGKYIVFVWFLDNWEEGQPLHGMVNTRIELDPNTDIDKDNNGRPGNQFAGLGEMDFASGIIDLSKDGEPLDDDDLPADWFDYNPSGNMSVDFGFYVPGGCPVINATLLGPDTLCADDKGTLQVEPASGTAPFSYKWDDGSTSLQRTNIGSGTFQVTLTDANGCTGVIHKVVESKSAANCLTTSVETQLSQKVKIFPNPILDQVQILSETNQQSLVSVYSIYGIKVHTTWVYGPHTSVDLSALPAGIYLILVKDNLGEVLARKRIIKM